MKNSFNYFLMQQKIIFIIRNKSKKKAIETALTVWEAGGLFVEVTLNSHKSLEVIKYLSKNKPNNCYLGAGTVKTKEEVQKASKAGASFIVTPIFNKELIKSTNELKLPSFIGAYTPSEIFQASTLGAYFIKIFPANTPSYIKSLKGPLNNIKMAAVGGVNLKNAHDFLTAGADIICVGGSFFNFDKNGNFNKKNVTSNIKKILTITKNHSTTIR